VAASASAVAAALKTLVITFESFAVGQQYRDCVLMLHCGENRAFSLP
jgi:hypothetical protein